MAQPSVWGGIDRPSTQRYCWVVIPGHDKDGQLPPGVHQATWDELRVRFGDGPQRARLLAGLYRAARSLKSAGALTLYVDGSFVSTKENPSDFDGCWEPAGVSLSKLDPVLLDFSNGRLAQKVKYGGELFPSSNCAELHSPRRTFLDFFQSDKQTGKPKGIVAIDLRRLP